jgi:putative spermidine/putrescine transport system permease protein
MALPTYASPLERVWHYTYLVICALIFLFLIAPILIVIPLSFNAEPYFTFTPKMLSFDPEGWSMRWYDSAADAGPSGARCAARQQLVVDVWERATWVQAAKNSFSSGSLGDDPGDDAGHHRGAWPVAAGNALSPADHGAADLAR